MRSMKVKDLVAKMSSYTILKVFDKDPALTAQNAFMAFIKVGDNTCLDPIFIEKRIVEMYTPSDEYTKDEILDMRIKDIFPGLNPECYIGAYVYPKKKRRWRK